MSQPIIELRGLTKRFEGADSVLALDHIDLTVEQGQNLRHHRSLRRGQEHPGPVHQLIGKSPPRARSPWKAGSSPP